MPIQGYLLPCVRCRVRIRIRRNEHDPLRLIPQRHIRGTNHAEIARAVLESYVPISVDLTHEQQRPNRIIRYDNRIQLIRSPISLRINNMHRDRRRHRARRNRQFRHGLRHTDFLEQRNQNCLKPPKMIVSNATLIGSERIRRIQVFQFREWRFQSHCAFPVLMVTFTF